MEEFSRQLEHWCRFVREVEDGYELTIYDYTNDLSYRDSIDTAVAAESSRVPRAVVEELSRCDERFRKATNQTEEPVLPTGTHETKWWWFRVPRKLVGELADDLRERRMT